MKIKQEIIERLNGRLDLKRELCKALDADRIKLWRWIRENDENGPLTTVKAVQTISSGLSLPAEEILIEEQSCHA